LISALLVSAALPVRKKPPSIPSIGTPPQSFNRFRNGPSTAAKILKMRKSYGPFKSVDVRSIKGIGPSARKKSAII
jgi:hypothetical protein